MPHPDLTNYIGVCPECNGKIAKADEADKPVCDLCGGAGYIGMSAPEPPKSASLEFAPTGTVPKES